MQQWLMIREEHSEDHYLWNGVFPIKVYGVQPWGEPNVVEVDLLNKALDNKRLKTIKFPGRLQRYIIVDRGEFTTP